MDLRIVLCINDLRNQPYSREVLPVLIDHVTKQYPEAELEVLLYPAKDWNGSREMNPDWKVLAFCSPIDFVLEEEITEKLDEELADLGASVWVKYA